MDSFDFEMAGLFCQRALDVDSTNLQALDMLGHIYSELGDTDKAKGISFSLVHSVTWQMYMQLLTTTEIVLF